MATRCFVEKDSRRHVFFRPGQLCPLEDLRSSNPAFIHSCGSFHPRTTTRSSFDGPPGMLLSPPSFDMRSAIDPRTSPCVLACSASDSLPREAAHVAKLLQAMDVMALDASGIQFVKIVGSQVFILLFIANDVVDADK